MTDIDKDLTPFIQSPQNRCFGCGPANPVGLHLDFLVAADQSVVSVPTLTDIFEGPPGMVHGGVTATVLDEAMSKSVRVRGLTAVTRQMEVEYLRPVPSGGTFRVEGRLIRSEGRKHWTEARILDGRSHVLATAKGLFIEVRASRLTPGQPEDRPEAD
jgi:uncharacterized protein (TIGR00369 family)